MFLNLYVRLRAALSTERGATAVEYGLLVAVIAMVMVAGAILLGDALNDLFEAVVAKFP